MRLAALALVIFVAAPEVARAEALAPIRLHYERRPGAEACPDEEQLSDAITTRLGFDPFSDQGKRLLEITVAAQGEGLEARIGLLGSTGALSGQRDLRSKSRECRDLSTVLVLAASMLLDPLSTSATDSAPLATAAAFEMERVPARHQTEIVASTSPTATEHSSGWEAGLAVVGEVGSVQSPSLGLALSVGLAWPLFAVTLEGQANLPVHEQLSTGSVASSQITGSLVPCVTQWHLGACALISAGTTLVSASGIEPAGTHAQPFFGLGARLYAGLPLLDWFEARLLLDVLVPVTQTSIVLNDSTTWTAPPVSGSLALALVTRFR